MCKFGDGRIRWPRSQTRPPPLFEHVDRAETFLPESARPRYGLPAASAIVFSVRRTRWIDAEQWRYFISLIKSLALKLHPAYCVPNSTYDSWVFLPLSNRRIAERKTLRLRRDATVADP